MPVKVAGELGGYLLRASGFMVMFQTTERERGLVLEGMSGTVCSQLATPWTAGNCINVFHSCGDDVLKQCGLDKTPGRQELLSTAKFKMSSRCQ